LSFTFFESRFLKMKDHYTRVPSTNEEKEASAVALESKAA
jgi:hypothetical protein